jgi:hypothetical protein
MVAGAVPHRPRLPLAAGRGGEVLTVMMITVMEQTPHLLAGLIAASTSARLGDRWNAGGLSAGALGSEKPSQCTRITTGSHFEVRSQGR